MPNDTPSPLALAREAEREAKFAMLDFVKTLGSKPSVPDLLHSAAKESAHAKARRATDEALVEATLRWVEVDVLHRDGLPLLVEGRVLMGDGTSLTLADVLTAIEKEGR